MDLRWCAVVMDRAAEWTAHATASATPPPGSGMAPSAHLASPPLCSMLGWRAPLRVLHRQQGSHAADGDPVMQPRVPAGVKTAAGLLARSSFKMVPVQRARRISTDRRAVSSAIVLTVPRATRVLPAPASASAVGQAMRVLLATRHAKGAAPRPAPITAPAVRSPGNVRVTLGTALGRAAQHAHILRVIITGRATVAPEATPLVHAMILMCGPRMAARFSATAVATVLASGRT